MPADGVWLDVETEPAALALQRALRGDVPGDRSALRDEPLRRLHCRRLQRQQG